MTKAYVKTHVLSRREAPLRLSVNGYRLSVEARSLELGARSLDHLRLLSCGGRFYPAHLSNSIMKGFRPAEPDKHGDQKKLAEQAHNDNCLGPSVADLRTDYNSKLRLRRRPQDHKTTGRHDCR